MDSKLIKEIPVFIDPQIPEDMLCAVYLKNKIPQKILVNPKRMDEFAMMINQPDVWASPIVKAELGWPQDPARISYIEMGEIHQVEIKGIVSV